MEAEKEINKFYNSKNFLAAIITGEEKELSFDLYSKEDLKTQKLKSIQLVKEYKPLWLIYEEENNIYIFFKNSYNNTKYQLIRRIIMKVLYYIALTLVIIGALNWLLIGLFDFNLVSTLFGSMSILSKIIYVLVGVSGLISIGLYSKVND